MFFKFCNSKTNLLSNVATRLTVVLIIIVIKRHNVPLCQRAWIINKQGSFLTETLING